MSNYNYKKIYTSDNDYYIGQFWWETDRFKRKVTQGYHDFLTFIAEGREPEVIPFQDISLEQCKDIQKKKVKQQMLQLKRGFGNYAGFETSIDNGQGGKIIVEARENGIVNDLVNMKELLEYAEDLGLSEINLFCYNNETHAVSLNDLETIIQEVRSYAVDLYQRKHQKYVDIDNCATNEQVREINF